MRTRARYLGQRAGDALNPRHEERSLLPLIVRVCVHVGLVEHVRVGAALEEVAHGIEGLDVLQGKRRRREREQIRVRLRSGNVCVQVCR